MRSLYFQWIKAHTIGGLIAWFLISFVAIGTLGFGLLAAGLILGFCLAISQYSILYKYSDIWYDKYTILWIVVNMVGAELGWLLAFQIRQIYYERNVFSLSFLDIPVLAIAIGGTLLTIMQWATLRWIAWRSHKQMIPLWLPANILGWLVGGFIGLQVGDKIYQLTPGSGIIFGPYEVLYILFAGVFTLISFSVVTGPLIVFVCKNYRSS